MSLLCVTFYEIAIFHNHVRFLSTEFSRTIQMILIFDLNEKRNEEIQNSFRYS